MIATAERKGISLRAWDVSRQKEVQVEDVPADATVGELVSGLLNRMSLPRTDVEGRPMNYHARLEREGRLVTTLPLPAPGTRIVPLPVPARQ